MVVFIFVPVMIFSVFFQFLSAEDAEDVSPKFQLVDPEMAPLDIRPQVMRGYKIMLETAKEVPEYAKDAVSCTNCHFSAGNTLGGYRGGLSLVGAALKYPISLGNDQWYTLAERINACFKKSLNGKPMPLESEDMKSIVAYLKWISSPVELLPNVYALPWLGLKKIRIDHRMDPETGKRLYQVHCALCHGVDGQGQSRKEDLSYPPLWGPHSFNDAAGMNVLPILATFIQRNMPYEDPSLTLAEALDIAAYIISQPRPHYEEKE